MENKILKRMMLISTILILMAITACVASSISNAETTYYCKNVPLQYSRVTFRAKQ